MRYNRTIDRGKGPKQSTSKGSTKMASITKITAEQRYDKIKSEVEAELKKTKKGLTAHTKGYKGTDRKSWGYAGDLEGILENLKGINSRFGW